MGNNRRIVSFELRRRDSDLTIAFDNHLARTKEDKANVIRDALRAYLGLGGNNIPISTEKRDSGPIWGADGVVERLPLTQIEKADEEVSADLDSLLSNF